MEAKERKNMSETESRVIATGREERTSVEGRKEETFPSEADSVGIPSHRHANPCVHITGLGGVITEESYNPRFGSQAAQGVTTFAGRGSFPSLTEMPLSPRYETSRNYNETSVNSGKVSRRLNSSSERTTGSEPRLNHGGDVSSGEKTPKGESLHMKEQIRSFGETETSPKREKFNDEVQTHKAGGEVKYGTGSNSGSRRQSNQSSSSYNGLGPPEPNPSSRKNGKDDGARRKSEEKKNRKQQETNKGYETSTEDSACSVFRGHWNENIKSASKVCNTETSDVSMMRRFVEGQSKALDLADERDDNLDSVDKRDHKGNWEPKCKDKHLTERKAVAAVLTFQRWRHTQLKRLFSLELKKVLEEAKEDEASLAKLEQDMATKDRHITQLRNQLSSYENAFEAQTVQRNAIDINIKELQSQMLKSLEKAATADDEIHKRDCEIRRLKEQLTSVDDEGIRIDSDLQSSIKKLQYDKESAINEGRILLTQLSRRDEEVVLQSKEIEKLKTTISHLSYQQTNSLKEIESLRAAEKTEVSLLQERLQNALAKHAKEVELVSSTERCNGFDQERQSLLTRLHQAEQRADLASQRVEELEVKLTNSTQERGKASDDIAEQMVEQLKRLAGHVKELETSMDKTALRFPLGIFQKKAVAASITKLSNKLALADTTSMDSLSHADSFAEPEKSDSLQDREEKQRQVSFSLPDEKSKSDHLAQTESSITNSDRGASLTMFRKWITWKWRWVASAAKAENLLRQLQARPITTVATEPVSDEGDDLTVTHRLVPVMMMAWRVFTRLSNLEKSATAHNESLKKITFALPWWIRRVGERRALERFFFKWLILSLRANRMKVQQHQHQTQKKQVSLSRPALSTKLAIHQSSQAASTAALPSPVKTIYRNAEAQTEKSARTPDADPKLESSSTRLRPMIPSSKTETRTASLPVQKSDTRKKPGAVPDAQRPCRSQKTKNGVTATAPMKQLRGFQNSFQQELKELQEVVSREMDSVDHMPAQRPSTAYRTQADPAKQALKSVFTVCTSLAQALSEVRAQLSGASEGGGGSVSKDRDSNKQQNTRQATHHYALPIGRYKSPQRQQPGEALATLPRERWPSRGDATGNSQTPTVRQPYENFTNQLQRFQETTDNMYRSFRNGRGYQQAKGRPMESSRGPRREPVRGENESDYDRRNAHVDLHPYANISGKYSNPQTGREDNNTHLRFGGQEKGRILLSDTGRLGGRTRFRTSKHDDKTELGNSSNCQVPPNCQHTTVVQIMNQDNNKIGEVSVHTHPLSGGSSGRGTGRVEGVSLEPRTQSLCDDTTINNGVILCSTQDTDEAHLRPSTAPNRSRGQGAAMRPTSAPRLHQSTTPARERDALDRGPTMNFINSLRRKPCIGADYADLLRTEIIRLREDRLSLEDKSLHTSPENHKDLPLIRRPGWRNVY